MFRAVLWFFCAWLAISIGLIGIAPSTASAQSSKESPLKKSCKDLYFGPYAYSKLKNIPLDLKFEACFDGTAWTELFNFITTLSGTLGHIQTFVDTAINSKTDSCDKGDFAVVIRNAEINSLQPDTKTQRALIHTIANIKRCKFPKLAADLAVEIPIVIELKTLHLTLGEPMTQASGGVLGQLSQYIPAMKKYINKKAKEEIQPYIDAVTKFQKENEAQLRILHPSAREVKLVTKDDALAVDVKLEAKLMKAMIENEAKGWLAQQGMQ